MNNRKLKPLPPLEALTVLQPEFPELSEISDYQEGRDELNLAEFPIAALSNRVDPKGKTVVFEDFTHDRSTGEIITRRLTVSASDRYGLPTASDDEIILGLLQLSRIQGFRSPKVVFTPYQLMKILGWPTTTKNYRRLHEGINRWLGVTLYYDNAWRDKRTQQWVDMKMHFLEYAEIYRPGKKGTKAPEGYSCFKWNDLVFQSFQAGNMKTLDFHLFRNLNSNISKRMFRFLDKRFHLRRSITFDLERFAFDKMGIPRSYNDMAQLKRRLLPGIQELEAVGFIKTVAAGKRFSRARTGIWEIHFEAAGPDGHAAACPKEADLTPLEGRLVGHGVTESRARRLTVEHPAEQIENQLDALEFVLTRGGEDMPQNRAGWLIQALTHSYSLPRGFKSRPQLEEEAVKKAEKQRQREEGKRKKILESKSLEAVQAEKQAMCESRVRAYMQTLTDQERESVERDALKTSIFKGRIGPVREAVIRDYVLSLLLEQEQ